MQSLKVGELARRTGLTVRTLHHYDELGLLSPAQRSGAGHRLYDEGDVARLQRIISLRQLGFGLDEIRACLEDPGFSAVRVLEMHIVRLRKQIEAERALCARLERLAQRLSASERVSADELIQTIGAMNMFEKYYTPEQLEELRQRGEKLGAERIREVESEWPELIAAVRAEMEAGTDPGDARVRALAARWQALVAEFTGNNPAIEESLRTMYRQEPSVRERMGIDPGIFEYVRKATAAAG
jgi:DNA-binding transcriptional MerR regulator